MTSTDWVAIWIGLPLAIVGTLFLALVFAGQFERWLEHLDYMKHHPGERGDKK